MRAHLFFLPLLLLGCVDNGLNTPIDITKPGNPDRSQGKDTAGWDDTGDLDTAQPEKDPEPEPDPEPDPEEVCDGIDNDGDGRVDEGFDADSDGIPDCEEQSYMLNLFATGDDYWTAWVDGDEIGTFHGWNQSDEFDYEVDSGHHVIAVQVEDSGECIVGFMAELKVNGSIHSTTGSGAWLSTSQSPGGGWHVPAFNDNAWHAARACQDTGPWETSPADLRQTGAEWVWPYADCRQIGSGFFRLNLYLP